MDESLNADVLILYQLELAKLRLIKLTLYLFKLLLEIEKANSKWKLSI